MRRRPLSFSPPTPTARTTLFSRAPARPPRPAWQAVLLAVLLGSLPLLAVRLWSLLAYAAPGELAAHQADIGRLFWMGWRFDLKLLATFWFVGWALAGLWLGFRRIVLRRPPARSGGRGWLVFWCWLGAWPLNFLALANHFFYGYYHTAFSPLVFGLIDDDTVVVLKTIWNDFPVVQAVLAVSLLTAVQVWLWRRVCRWNSAARVHNPTRWQSAGHVLGGIALTLLLLFLARGQVGSQPLTREDFTISSSRLLCDLVPNGGIALSDAWDDYHRQVRLEGDVLTGLKAQGYATPLAAGQALGIAAKGDTELISRLQARTPDNAWLKAHPPHVVTVLFESWGAQALQRHGPGNDLLGRMAKHAAEDYWFERAFSGQRGTHPSIEAMLINTPITPLTQGRYGDFAYPTAGALPFKAAGYHTVFIYGGSARWRNLDRALRNQGFDEVLGTAEIMQARPDAVLTDNGTHDEYTYALAEKILAADTQAGRPTFLVIMNTSNHTPYNDAALPKNHPFRPIDMGRFADVTLPAHDAKIGVQLFQYATDTLGGFVDRIKAAPYGERTLVAATGDHHLRSFFQLSLNADAAWLDRVGFYLRVPKAYAGGAHFDRQRVLSHRDLLPTLYHRALSGARYFDFGDDVLARPEKTPRALSLFSRLYTADGAWLELPGGSTYRFDADWRKLEAAPASPALASAVKEERARIGLQDWLIRRTVLANEHSPAASPKP